ncbi:hypothetical protein [Staphylococcus shinii]|uniref:hypothetical protein n=1 Tax=Staphylococcus shinii TaxID=2912228 RepID=UPI003F571308
MNLKPYEEYIEDKAKQKRNNRQYNSPSYKDRSTIVINNEYKDMLDRMWEEENKISSITKRELTNRIIKEYMDKNYPNLH